MRSRSERGRDSGLDPNRIAEIIVRTTGGGRRGSGYRISTNLILTAAHVIADATETVVRCNADRPGEWSAGATTAWVDARSDLAVLTVSPPTGAPATVEPVRFGRLADDRHDVVSVHAAGFPLWKRRDHPDGVSFRELHVANGTVSTLSNLRTGTLEISVEAAGDHPASDTSPWAGMSGALVWTGSCAIGVVSEQHHREGAGRLTAVRFDHELARIGDASRADLTRLLGLVAGMDLPLALSGASDGEPTSDRQVVGIPVAHGLDVFKNRTVETEAIAGHFNDPSIRMVTLIGPRGIGKSALAAKVMDLFHRGEWPGTTQGPSPFGLVNLSTRTSGISLERIYFSCARLLSSDKKARLLDVWAEGGTTQDRLDALFEAVDGELIVILMDNLEELLDDDGRIEDEELAIFFDWLFLARSTPRLLITSQIPVRIPPERRRFTAKVELSKGLSPAEAVDLLRDLDGDGSLGIAQLPDDELLQAAVHVHGVPRALELLVGAVAEDEVLLPTLSEVLQDFTRRHDVVTALAQGRHDRLDEPARIVLDALATLRTPADQATLEEVLGGIAPDLQVITALKALARARLVTVARENGTVFSLHPLDADIARDRMPWDGPFGRQAMERRTAAWYAHRTQPSGTWRSPEDLEAHRRQFTHFVNARDHDEAARVLNEISEWLVWHGSVLAAIGMHREVHGHIRDERIRLAHTAAYGHARLSAGPMEQAIELFTEAIMLAERLGDQLALQNALFGLGDAHRQLGDLGATVEPLARAAELAHELGDAEREAHALLSLSLAHSYLGNGDRALTVADQLAERAKGGDQLTVARAGNARTIVMLRLERWQEAIDAGAETARAYRVARTPEAIAYAVNAQGLGYLALGDPIQAASALEEARHEASLMENPRAEGVCLLNLSWAHWRADRLPQAATTADRAWAALQIAGAPQAKAAQSIAEAARALPADPQAASTALTRAAEALDGNPEIIAPTWLIAEALRLGEQ